MLVPVVVIGGVELLADWILDPYLPFPLDTAAVTAAVFLLALVFTTVAGRRIAWLSRALEARSLELEHRGSVGRALHQLGVRIAATRDLSTVAQMVADEARRLLAADVAFVQRPDVEGVRAVACSGSTDALGSRTAPSDTEPAAMLAPAYRASVVAAPLLRGSSTVGALVVAGADERTFSVDELETLSSLANLLALAIENARLEALLREMAVSTERERIAREMHDGLAQVLGYVNTKSQAVEALLEAHRLNEARSQLGDLAAAARSIYVDVREAILGLANPVNPERGLVGAVEEYAARFADSAKLAVRVDASEAAVAMDLAPEVQAQAFRIVQEALTNIRKHADAARVRIALDSTARGVEVSVTDDGRGVAAAIGAGRQDDGWPRFGLEAMKQRAAAIGGTLEVRAAADGGTAVRLHLAPTAPAIQAE